MPTFRRSSVRWHAWAGALSLLVQAAISSAVPHFDQSSFAVRPPDPVEGDVVSFVLSARNDGDVSAEPAEITVTPPVMGYLLSVAGLDEVATDLESGRVSGKLNLPAGVTKEIEIRVLAPRDSGGDALSVSARIIHYGTMAEAWVHQTVTVASRPATGGVLLGPIRVLPAALAVLGWLLLLGLVWAALLLLARGRFGGVFGPSAAAVALMVPVGFWIMFGAMAWRDYRILTAWPEASATIVGRRLIAESTTGHSSPSSRSRDSGTVYRPELALRYRAGDRELYSAGYDSGSSLRMGGRSARGREMAEWVPGAVIACWYDPDDPFDVVVKRGFGGAYVFVLLTLPVFWIGCKLTGKIMARR